MSAIGVVLRAAEARGTVRRVGNQYLINCPDPDHPDVHPSCYIAEKEDGRVVIDCKSKGCAFKAMAKGLGLTEQDFFPSKAEKSAARRTGRNPDPAQKAIEAACKAQTIIDAGHDARNDHPYAVRKLLTLPATLREISQADAKRILGYPPKCKGEPLQGRLLVVPVYIADKLSTCELIDGAGRKSAVFGGTKRGGLWTTADLPEGDGTGLTIIIGEGVATVISATMATGHLGVAALCWGNLLAAGKTIRQRYPRAKLVFVADLGIGVQKSSEAARAVDGYVAVPNFGDGQ
jgi:putative DNA primase/helicase